MTDAILIVAVAFFAFQALRAVVWGSVVGFLWWKDRIEDAAWMRANPSPRLADMPRSRHGSIIWMRD